MESATLDTAQYLDEDGEPIKASGDVKVPDGYSLLKTTKSPATPKKIADVKELKKLAKAKAPITPPKGYILNAPPDYTSNPKNEGLYEMYGKLGNGDAVGNLSVPYSRVQSFLDSGGTFAGDAGSQERYAKDKAAEGKPVSWYQSIVQSPKLAPVPHEAPGNMIGNAERAAARTILATPAYAKSLMDAAQSMHRGEVSGGDEFANLINPFQIPKQMYDQFKEDAKTDPKMAVDNLLGSAVGLGVVGAVTHGVVEKGKSVLSNHPFTPITEPPVRERTNILHRNDAGEVRQANGQAPSVWLSPNAWKSLMNSMYPAEDHTATNGMNLPFNKLHEFSSDPRLSSNPEVQELLTKAHENAGDSGANVLPKTGKGVQHAIKVLREELNHTWQRGLANGNVNQHLDPQAFTNLYHAIPSGMYDHLVENGYSGHNSPEMVTEAAAKLMDGRPERFGVDTDDAVDFLDKYFKSVTEKHGAKALEELHHVRGIAADAKARAIEEHGRTGGGQDNSTVPSVAAGGQGGAAQGVQAAGEQVAFTRNHALGIDEPHTIPVAMKDGTPFTLQRWFGGKYKIVGSNGENIGTIGYLRYPDGSWKVSGVEVAPEFRRKGVATAAYNALEKVVGAEFQDTGSQTEQGRLFWEGRDKQKQAGQDTPLFNREQEKDKPIWYLKSERLIGEKMRGPMPAQDVSKMLLAGGVKPEEMHWTGLEDFLKSKGNEKVTPQEIKDHLAENNLHIKEVTKGENPSGNAAKKYLQLLMDKYGVTTEDEVLAKAANSEITELTRRKNQSATPTKYGSYVLPGGERYREMLITAPNLGESPESKALTSFRDKMDAKYDGSPYGKLTPDEQSELTRLTAANDAARPAANYQSSHWEEPNILAHVRFNDRTGPNGEKLLHIEEAQSDWGQRIRKEGVKKTPEELTNIPLVATKEGNNAVWEVHTNTGEFVTNVVDFSHSLTADDAIKEARRRLVENPRQTANSLHQGQPDMPWKRNWHEQALRRMVRYAVDHNYDGVSWTPGADQNERYSLSHQVDKIAVPKVDVDGYRSVRIEPIGEGTDFKMTVSPDGTVEGYYHASQFSGKKLDEVVGKEMAERIMAAKEPTEFEGKGLDVGGSGMRGFYDKIVPDYLNKFGKKFGSKVGETEFPVPGDKRITIRRGINGWDVESRLDENVGREQGLAFFSDEDYGGKEGAQKAAQKDAEERSAPRKTVQYLPITPEMRESVGKEGVPLFNREQVKTPEFKKWFGDWEDKDAYSSKRDENKTPVSMAVNPDGTPRVFYHGTQGNFDTFEANRPTKNTGMMGIPYDATRAGIFFATDPKHTMDWMRDWDKRGNERVAKDSKTMPVYLNIKQPLDLDGRVLNGVNTLDEGVREDFEKEGINPRWWNSVQHSWELFDDEDGKKFVAAAKRLGYDGATIREDDLDGNEHDVWVAFEPNQIKSAIGNSGAFDPNDPSILRNREKSPDANSETDQFERIAQELGSKGKTYNRDIEEALKAAGLPHNKGTQAFTAVSKRAREIGEQRAKTIREENLAKRKASPEYLESEQELKDAYGDEWDEMTEEERHDAVESDLDRKDEEREEEEEKQRQSEEYDRQLEKKIAYMDDKQKAVEDELTKRGFTFTVKGRYNSSRYITVDHPDEDQLPTTIRISDHEPAVGIRGGAVGGYNVVTGDRHDAADLSFHPGEDDISRLDDVIPENTNAAGPNGLDPNPNVKGDGGQKPETDDRGSTTAPVSVVPVQGGTHLAAAPVQQPVVPVPTKNVLPLHQIKAMAAGLNPSHNPYPQVGSVRDLINQAKSRMIP